MIKKILYAFYLVIVSLLLLELILRLYNPFHFRIRASQLVLPTNQSYWIKNTRNSALDSQIYHRVNGLGFRGPEKPDSLDHYLSILAVGGSTTECTYLSEGKTWTDQLAGQLGTAFPKSWLNNAGFNGHSTYGHLLLVNDYLSRLHPKVVLLLVGCNDVERDDLTWADGTIQAGKYHSLTNYIAKNSELANVVANLLRYQKAREKMLVDKNLDLQRYPHDTLVLSGDYIGQSLRRQQKYLASYRQRLQTLVEACTKNGILPVLITQPSLVGAGIDSVSGASLEKVRLGDSSNGIQWWKILELYNQVTREVAQAKGIPLIDLATKMPKSSLYFYDIIHFTNTGAKKVAEIISPPLQDLLREKFPAFYTPTR